MFQFSFVSSTDLCISFDLYSFNSIFFKNLARGSCSLCLVQENANLIQVYTLKHHLCSVGAHFSSVQSPPRILPSSKSSPRTCTTYDALMTVLPKPTTLHKYIIHNIIGTILCVCYYNVQGGWRLSNLIWRDSYLLESCCFLVL